ncbi:MAG: hypothetical protein WA865_23660 [Spirulinaceae cyanobacterium]
MLKPFLYFVSATLLLIASTPSAQGNQDEVPQVVVPAYPHTSSQPSMILPSSSSNMIQAEVKSDPLDSPHPVPWNWVLETNENLRQNESSGVNYYRSPSLISPDKTYAAYSRIQMEGRPELFRSRVTSVMFLENLHTGDLQTITASSPLADNPFNSNEEARRPGKISILIPVSWSDSGDRVLARQFEGFFNTSDASDYAVIWERNTNRTATVAPENDLYTNAVLLGWSETDPEQVLFRAGTLGEENWPLWAVDAEGQTMLASEDKPIVYGQVINKVWSGPQARW